ncbi:CPBP family intramembrane glutamic endopeptidase [uncultured Anaerococcus sp.]|uniref:CPBP family intramembrane glutamic endopeptidase n=1 Tax=uncultured Anaerococcus sp. TaxID=293428 RepID=UPI00260944FF|nr:type II CAAX endopeptidase family protein [uncultured Anaerococcus sp.]
MRANKSILEAREKSRDLNPVIITVILSLLVVIPQYFLGLILKFSQNIEILDGFWTYLDTNDLFFLLIIYSTAITLILAYIFARKILKRSNLSLGLVDNKKVLNYGKGILLGFGLLSLIVLILNLSGFAEITPNLSDFNLKLFLIFVIAWLIQGFEEEFLLRSILMNQLAAGGKIEVAIIANSLIFSIFHLGNTGFSVLALVNVFLMGLVFSLIFYLKDSIYLVGAAHSFWNMTMANIYGITVSGNSSTGVNLFNTKLTGPTIISGGSFGIEGSIVTSLVLLVVLIILIRKIKKSDFAN